jgi:hypothetical protein
MLAAVIIIVVVTIRCTSNGSITIVTGPELWRVANDGRRRVCNGDGGC